ncbi:SDR family oxidoreductase [Caldisericum exile]|uniref:UDP-glucose 4-epimerase n=1 Tax=Caldisericum exile (strain DSM 21853 / NBRC 104410 / AZM16c01) TaxID=511051 RepID=A0A7U6JFC7_CALEA|nr:SDR family oxidoreductase [Caldisericum exile]BAL81651.1 UDP-glucose 4-epimerase [Caldisericum exile AZM16c01]
MRILVTGGAGFIGSNVVDAFVEKGFEVGVLDNLSTGKEKNINPKAKFYNVDLRDFSSLEKVFVDFKPEIVDHHAAQIDVRKSVKDPSFDAEVNIIGSINLFDLAVKYGVRRIIFASTGGALYGEPKVLPANEDTPIKPLSPYGVSKYCMENYLNYFKRLHGIERVILRYANVYGPRQDPLGEAGVIAIFTGRILEGKPVTIFGDGTQTRDFIYVEDVVSANLLALDGVEGTYNIGTGNETSVNEIVQVFEKVLRRKVEVEYAKPRPGEVYRIALDYTRAKQSLGFEPKYTLEEGIKKTIEWYTKNMK